MEEMKMADEKELSEKERKRLVDEIREIGPWFHQIEIAPGIQTRDIAPSPGPQPLDHPMSRWRVLQNFLPENLQGGRILDIGCADGFFALELASRGANVVAVDANLSFINRLNWVIKEKNIKNIETRHKTLEALDRKERFDFIFMIALLYHLKCPIHGLEVMADMTDVLYLETTLWTGIEGPYMYFKPPQPGVHAIPKWFPTDECVQDMLKSVGFSNVRRLPDALENRGIYIARK